uniref:Uncharacterized protein n=1 Tax=Cucumis melo TaxID=3656 RepID=A0A9I9CU96_CUCME
MEASGLRTSIEGFKREGRKAWPEEQHKRKSTTGHRRWENWHELVKHAKNGLADDWT